MHKDVTYNGVAPSTSGQKSALAGTYTFKVFKDENCTVPYRIKQGQSETDLTLTVTIGDDGASKPSEVVELPAGNYWIEEVTPGQSDITPDANRLPITVTAENTTEAPASSVLSTIRKTTTIRMSWQSNWRKSLKAYLMHRRSRRTSGWLWPITCPGPPIR